MIDSDLLLTILVYYCGIGFIFASIAHVVEEWSDSSMFMFHMWTWPILTTMIVFDYYISFLNHIRKKLRGLK
jgi:hypothetical protein